MNRLIDLLWKEIAEGWTLITGKPSLPVAIFIIGVLIGGGAIWRVMSREVYMARQTQNYYKSANDCLDAGIKCGKISDIAEGDKELHPLNNPYHITIPKAFSYIYDQNQTLLGPPVYNSIDIPNNVYKIGVYQAYFDSGRVFWDNQNLGLTVLLMSRDGDPSFRIYPDYNDAQSRQWFNSAFVTKTLGIPTGSTVPFGGTANLLYHHRQIASALGSMLWQCLLSGSSIYRQEFRNGFIFGPVREAEGGDDGAGILYAFIYDQNSKTKGKYYTAHAINGPACIKPVFSHR